MLLSKWNQTVTTFPEKIAASEAGRMISYRELDHLSSSAANRLTSSGVAAGEIVAISVSPGIDYLIVLLGLFKINASYTFIDMSYPLSRQEQMLTNSKVEHWITDRGISESFRGTKIPLPSILSPADTTYQALEEIVDLACVIYTSGTTGTPKAVPISRSALVNLIAPSSTLKIDSSDRLAQISNPSFDAINFEIWGSLLNGAELIFFSKETVSTAERFRKEIEEHRISFVFLTTGLFNAIVLKDPDALSTIKWVVTGGEKINREVIRRLFDVGRPPKHLIHAYGPTECTTFATMYLIEDPESSGSEIPIGTPLQGVNVMLLDSNRNPVPYGEVGELYLYGSQIAKGYLNQEDLTQEKFISLPMGDQAGGVNLYKTGDLVKWDKSGNLVFVDRVDHEVKVNGFRLNLKDIEGVLITYPGVVNASCLVERKGSQTVLEAYILNQSEINFEQLLSHLEKQLPSYMLPHAFYLVDSIPTNANGKVDFAMLQRIAKKRLLQEVKGSSSQQLTRSEQFILDRCRDLLQLEEISIDHNFLFAGGDSLKAMELIASIFEHTGKVIAAADLRKSKDLKELASLIDSISSEATLPSYPCRSVASCHDLSSGQYRLWVEQQINPSSILYNEYKAFSLKGELGPNTIQEALTRTAAKHPVLRSYFPVLDTEPSTAYLGEDAIALEEVECSKEDWKETALNIIRKPYDLRKGDLFRAALLHIDDDEAVLLFAFHHIILDGWSLDLLFEELSGMADGQMAPQMADFIAWEKLYRKSPCFDQQASYWREQYKQPIEPLMTISTALSEPRAASHSFVLDSLTLSAFKRWAQKRGVTLNSLLFSVASLLLSRYYGQKALSLGAIYANRRLPTSQEVIGFLANTVLIAVEISLEESLVDFVQSIDKKLSLEAFDHQEFPYSDLIAELQKNGMISSSDLIDVLIVLQTSEPKSIQLPEVTTTPIDLNFATGKFKLMLSMEEAEGELRLVFDYQTNYFNQESIHRLERGFKRGLNLILASPDSRVGQFDLLEVDLLLGEEKASPSCSSRFKLEQLFQNEVDLPAIIEGDLQLSYGELAQRVEEASRGLIALGALEQSLVGVSLDRGIDLIVIMLACVKANLVFVPLDKHYPESYLNSIIEIADPHLLISDAAISYSGREAHSVEEVFAAAAGRDQKASSYSDDSILYVIFSSGSTGTPKGIKVPRKTINHLIGWQLEEEGLSKPLRTLQYASLNFDVSFQEIFGTLAQGGSLVLINEADRKDQRQLLKHLEEWDVERLYLPYAALQTLADSAVTLDLYPKSLKQIISAGEQLYCTRAIRQFCEMSGVSSLWNMYGPSETHVVTSYQLEGDSRIWPDKVPIGRTIPDVTLHLINELGFLSPPYYPGEIYLSGVATHPCYFSNEPSHRFVTLDLLETSHYCYRTGDLAYRDEEGVLYFLGRNDNQIKNNGYRIELEQIELALMQQRGVRNASVIKEGRLVAFIQGDPKLEISSLRSAMEKMLPGYLLPSDYVVVDEIPVTPSGKIDRSKLVIPLEKNCFSIESSPLYEIFCMYLGVDCFDVERKFFELGLNSLSLAGLHIKITKEIYPDLRLVDFFSYPTFRLLSNFLDQEGAAAEEMKAGIPPHLGKIAVVGMSGSFPGSSSIEEFFYHAFSNVEGVVRETGSEENPTHVPSVAMLAHPFGFDPAYFGIAETEAAEMDPQQRHILMGAVQCLKDAKVDPSTFSGRIGAVLSAGENSYYQELMRRGYSLDGNRSPLMHEKDFLATKVAYHLNLHGPCYSLQSACSSSLIAIHDAAQQLQLNNSDVMLAGGVLIDPTKGKGYHYQPGYIFSPNGRCRPFSCDANGTIPGNGYALVALKRLEDALKNGDRIYAVIEGSAVNNDGSRKVGYTAPSIQGQVDVIKQALSSAGIEGGKVGYIEAHGTGTALGDPIEFEALKQGYGKTKHPIAISSLKSLIGHLGAAAGTASFIRAVLSIYYGKIPGNIGFERASPEIQIEESPFFFPLEALSWKGSRKAGITSLGIGGTNAHLILGQPPFTDKTFPQCNEFTPLHPFKLKDYTLLKESDKDLGIGEGFYDYSWRQSKYQQLFPLRSPSSSTLLILTNHFERGRELKKKLIEYGCSVCLAYDGKEFKQEEADLFSLRIEVLDDYCALLKVIKNRPGAIEVIHYMHSSSGQAGLEGAVYSQDQALYHDTLILLMQAADLTRTVARLKIGIILDEAFDILGTEIVKPTAQIALGAYSVIPQEFTGVTTSVIDSVMKNPEAISRLACILAKYELSHCITALRGGKVWVRELQKIKPMAPSAEEKKGFIRSNGTYLVTGGLGGIGLTLAGALAEQKKVHLILLTRSTEAPKHLTFANGSTFQIINCCVTDEQALGDALKPYKQINGVIHSAGLAGGKSIIHHTPGNDSKVFAAKLQGTVALMNVLKGHKLDFFVASSSHASSTGGLGQIDYCAANNVLEALVASFSSRAAKVSCIAWDAWQEVGMAVNQELPHDLALRQKASVERGITPKQGVEIFWEALCNEAAVLSIIHHQEEEIEDKKALTIEGIIKEHLGFIPDSDASLQECGVHSLMAIEIVYDINTAFGSSLTINEFIQGDTLAHLGNFIIKEDEPVGPENSPILLHVHPQMREERKLFLIHPIGGGLFHYRDLAKQLDSFSEIYGFQDPNLLLSALQGMSIEERAALYISQLKEKQCEGPYYLGGWSFGAIVAYEMSLQLQKSGEAVALLGIIDAGPPSGNYIEDPDTFTGQMLSKEFSEGMDEASQAYIDKVGQVCRYNYKALQEYRSSKKLDADVVLVKANQSHLPVGMDLWRDYLDEARCSWVALDGDHYSILKGSNAEMISDVFNSPYRSLD